MRKIPDIHHSRKFQREFSGNYVLSIKFQIITYFSRSTPWWWLPENFDRDFQGISSTFFEINAAINFFFFEYQTIKVNGNFQGKLLHIFLQCPMDSIVFPGKSPHMEISAVHRSFCFDFSFEIFPLINISQKLNGNFQGKLLIFFF